MELTALVRASRGRVVWGPSLSAWRAPSAGPQLIAEPLRSQTEWVMRYFEDIEIGKRVEAGPYEVTQEEIIEFAQRWDPRPYHTDAEAALRTTFKGLAASGAHTISIYYRLLYELSQVQQEPLAAIAALGFDVKLPSPVRPNDRLTLTTEPIEKRDSDTNPRAGIAVTRGILVNQSGAVVLEIIATGLFAKRPV